MPDGAGGDLHNPGMSQLYRLTAGALWLAAIAAGAQTAGPTQPNLLPEAAKAVGVQKCLAAVTRLSALAVAGSRNHDVLVDWDRARPDDGAFFSLLGINYGGQSVAATITTIPQQDGCTLAAERISVAPFTCQSIAQVELGGYRSTSLLPSFTVYTRHDDPGASVSLIDSPPGCLVIRRHVQYAWKEPPITAPRSR